MKCDKIPLGIKKKKKKNENDYNEILIFLANDGCRRKGKEARLD